MRAELNIFRFDPDSNEEARYQEFILDVEPRETVLSVLKQVYEKCDPSLSFRFACGVMKCGECSIVVNKSPCLACERIIEPAMTIEPLPNLTIIKDLVIDRKRVFDMIFRLAPLLRGPKKVHDTSWAIDLQNIDTYVELTGCYECLICQSVCPVYKKKPDQFVGPLGLLWLAQASIGSSNEDNWNEMVKAMLEMCEECGVCWESCPFKINILELAINTLNKRVIDTTT